MNIWTVRAGTTVVNITAHTVTKDLLADNVIWADNIRIAFQYPVDYIEEL